MRGLGLMVGAEFTQANGLPATEVAKHVVACCLEESLLLLSCGTYGNVVRWIPSLLAEKDQIETALAIFERALASCS